MPGFPRSSLVPAIPVTLFPRAQDKISILGGFGPHMAVLKETTQNIWVSCVVLGIKPGQPFVKQAPSCSGPWGLRDWNLQMDQRTRRGHKGEVIYLVPVPQRSRPWSGMTPSPSPSRQTECHICRPLTDTGTPGDGEERRCSGDMQRMGRSEH